MGKARESGDYSYLWPLSISPTDWIERPFTREAVGMEKAKETGDLCRIQGNAGVSAETLRAWNVNKSQNVLSRLKNLELRMRAAENTLHDLIANSNKGQI